MTEVQHIVIMAEHKLLDYKDVEKRFTQIKPRAIRAGWWF